MATAVFMAGVADVDLYSGDQLFASAKTLADTSISIGVTLEDIRAGKGAKLWGKYAHSPTMDIQLNDVMFKLDYIAKNVGGDIEIGGDATVNEQVTVSAGKQITVKQDPVDFSGAGTIGWVSKPNSNVWQKVTFTGKSATLGDVEEGEKLCVKYFANFDSARKLTISANFIPDTIHAVMTAQLFAGDVNNPTSQNNSLIGNVVFDIPRLMLSGNQEIAMSMTGASQMPLTGTALASSETGSCDQDAKYATITEVIFEESWKDSCYALAIENADITLNQQEKETLRVYALFPNAVPKLINNSELTFTAEPTSSADVDNKGVITATTTAGNTKIHVVLTGKPMIDAYAYVTVE